MKTCETVTNPKPQKIEIEPGTLVVKVDVPNEKASKLLSETFPTFESYTEDMSTIMEGKEIPNVHIVWVLWWFMNQTQYKEVKYYNAKGKDLLDLQKHEQGFVVKRSFSSCSGVFNYRIFFSYYLTVEELWTQYQTESQHTDENEYFLVRNNTYLVKQWLNGIINTRVGDIGKDYHLQNYPTVAIRSKDYRISAGNNIQPLSLSLVDSQDVPVEINIHGDARAKIVEACMYSNDFLGPFRERWLKDTQQYGSYRLFLENPGKVHIKEIRADHIVLTLHIRCTTVFTCAYKRFLEPHLDMLETLRSERWELKQLQEYALKNWNLSCAEKTREEIVNSLEHILVGKEWLKILDK